MDFDWHLLKNNINELPKLVNSIIKQSENNINKLLIYDCIEEKDKFLRLLEKDTIEINKIYSLLNLMDLTDKNNVIESCYTNLIDYNSKLKSNGNFLRNVSI